MLSEEREEITRIRPADTKDGDETCLVSERFIDKYIKQFPRPAWQAFGLQCLNSLRGQPVPDQAVLDVKSLHLIFGIHPNYHDTLCTASGSGKGK